MLALVLLPGLDGTGLLFSDFIDALGGQYETIVVRYPPDKLLGYQELTEFARASLPVDKEFILLGESFSGPIAVSLAASAPKGLVGLVLCCSFAKNPRPLLGWLRTLVRLVPFKLLPDVLFSYLLVGRFATAPLQRALANALAQVSGLVLAFRIAAVLGVNVMRELAAIRVPILYLRGTQDCLVPRSAAALVAQSSPQVKMVDFEAPHLLLQVVPARAAEVIGELVGGEAELYKQK